MLQLAIGLGLGLVLGYSAGRMQVKRDLPEADRENRKRPLSRPASSSNVAAHSSMPSASEIAAAKAARARLGYQGGAVPVRTCQSDRGAEIPQCLRSLGRNSDVHTVRQATSSHTGKLPDGPEPIAQDTEYPCSSELQPLATPATAAQASETIKLPDP